MRFDSVRREQSKENKANKNERFQPASSSFQSETNLSLQVQTTTVKNTAMTLSLAGRKPPVIYVRKNSSEVSSSVVFALHHLDLLVIQIIWFAHPADYRSPMELEATIKPAD